MRPLAIRVQGLSKQYRLGARRPRHDTLRDAIAEGARGLWRRSNRTVPPPELIWALEDVSFEVTPGEVVGIIGRNGAGKSTLLKILSRITEPTRGRAEIYGRVGSLLEVGTGFHPELTGRENVYLSGAVLGMKKAETARQFDDIVAFSEIEPFIDTPIKRYSSGMYVRLAFAVAAHLNPEILIVDEVLAVGDAAFQRKCLGKMGEIARQDRTVLFVSHSMATVQQLCGRVLLLSSGELAYDGETGAAIERYFGDVRSSSYVGAALNGQPAITEATARWDAAGYIMLDTVFSAPAPLTPPVLGFVLYDVVGVPVFGTNARFEPHAALPEAMQRGRIAVRIPTRMLRPGSYRISLWLGDRFQDYCQLDHALSVDVGRAGGKPWQPRASAIGSVVLEPEWQYLPLSD